MVDNAVGRLFEMGNAGSMANAGLSELSSKADLQSKGAVGRKRVLDRFTLEGNAEAFLGAYGRAIESLE